MPNKRALIVDDSTTAQYRLKKMLRPYDLDTDSVDSGEAALRYLATNIPDVIFMDHLMPGMDGFRALQIIKSHPETAMIPVIMYTSKSGDVYTGQARALGALDVVSKDSINAADLSNVMRNIHIYRTDENVSEETKNNHKKTAREKAEEVVEATPNVVDVTNHSIERKTYNTANAEQARNLELRLSHMEHTLEDSRRFITDRVVRELQSLKQNIKQEFNEIAEHNHARPIVAEVEEPSGGIAWAIVSKLLIIVPLGLIAFYLVQMNDALTQGQQQQAQLSKQINAINVPAPVAPVPTTINLGDKSSAPYSIIPPAVTEASKRMDKSYLADIAWTFNQTATLAFNQNDIDTKVVIRLYELLNRLVNSGFKGKAAINIFVGNFCLATDNVGQAQLVSEYLPMGNCMLSSEVYGLDRLMEQYAHDVEVALAGLDQKSNKNLNIVITTLSEPDNYPERRPTMSAKTWNTAAQSHNRIEINLEAKPEVVEASSSSSTRAAIK